MKQFDSGEYYIVVVDKFAQRIHEHIPESGNIVLCDATSNLDRSDAKLFRFITPTVVGGQSLGYIIVSSESESNLTEAFAAYRDILHRTKAFHHRGAELGPSIFLTDDAASEINSLRYSITYLNDS